MINENLFESVLINPVKQGADKLFIISGYVTSAMAFHHLNTMKLNRNAIGIDLNPEY